MVLIVLVFVLVCLVVLGVKNSRCLEEENHHAYLSSLRIVAVAGPTVCLTTRVQ